MIVSELIEKLQAMPQDWDVNVRNGSVLVFPYSVEAREDSEDRVVLILDKEAAS